MEVFNLYEFILNMWILNRINESKVRSYVPFYITENESNMILSKHRLVNY